MSLLGMGTFEILIILLVAFIFLGPERMIDAARLLGKWTGELRRMGSTVQAEMDDLANVGSPLSSMYTQSDRPQDRNSDSPPLDQDHPAEASDPVGSPESGQDEPVSYQGSSAGRDHNVAGDTEPTRREEST